MSESAESADARLLRFSHSYLGHLKVRDEPEDELKRLGQRLARYGFKQWEVKGDGNCVLRALSHQLFGTQKYHVYVRRTAVAQLKAHRNLYIKGRSDAQYDRYCYRVSKLGTCVREEVTQAAIDALKVKMIELVSLKTYSIAELIPASGAFKTEIYLCSTADHSDSMFPADRKRPEVLPPLTSERIKSIKDTGFFKSEDLKRHKRIKFA